MKAEIQCIPCFLNQAVEALELTGADRETRVRTMKHLISFLDRMDFDLSPPELSMYFHRIIREETGNPDPYIGLKEMSTETVQKLMPYLKELMEKTDDPLALSIKLGALGNVIDFGTPIRMNIEEMVDEVVNKELTVWDYNEFTQALEKADRILFLGDNAGEILLDRFLLHQLKERGKTIIYGVREGPIINDATTKEAGEAGITEFADLITTGSHAPGTILKHSTVALKEALGKADMIISKGQGNFESLADDPKLMEMVIPGNPIFFLLTIKCGIVGDFGGVPQGSTIFRQQILG